MTDRLTEKEIEEIRERYESATNARGLPPVLTDTPRLLDEVERLREERDRYREALTAIHEMSDLDYNFKQGFMACDMKTIAENALEGTEEVATTGESR